MKKCRKCNISLVSDKNWYKSNEKLHSYICNYCHRRRVNKWRKNNLEKTHEHQKKYRKTEKGKNAHGKSQKKYYYKHKKYCINYSKNYRKTKKGKEVEKRHQSKRNRNLEWIKLYENPFDKSEKIEWHHYNDEFVVALPKDLHRLHLGKNHRENIKPIVNQIYFPNFGGI